MTTVWTRWSTRAGLLAALAILPLVLSPSAAHAGVATYGAVLLDPYDITPGIGFGHGCNDVCGGGGDCGYGCHRRHCEDGCHRARCSDDCRRARCADGCGRPQCGDRCGEARCEDRCNGPEVRPAEFAPCEGRCSDTEHWEHRWRNGDRVGEEWYERGRRERDIQGGAPPQWYGHNRDWHDGEDDDDAPAPAAAH